MPKLYTKKGDNGTSVLYRSTRIPKSDHIFEALGDLDELSSFVGLVTSYLPEDDRNTMFLRGIQGKLLDIGSDLATPKKTVTDLRAISSEDISELEEEIDRLDEKNTPLTEFILPGTCQVDSFVHICRGVCRRAERHMWKATKKKPTGEDSPRGIFHHLSEGETNPYVYMNRLSDYFFALARSLSVTEFRRSQLRKNLNFCQI